MGAAHEEGVALSQNPNAVLESTGGATAGGPAADGPGTRAESSGRGARSAARRKKGLLRRFGIIIPAIGAAAILVVLVTVVSYVMSPNGTGATAMSTALNGLTHSRQVTLLEQEQQEIATMDAAAKTLTTAASPAKVDPDEVIQAAQQATSSSSSGSSSTGTEVAQVAPPDPGTAEQIGYNMVPSFGFNQTTQWSCLEQLWMRESDWLWDAENLDSGAYGIPQALPGYKMASAGADWRTDPTTQIKWGLEYISATYGTPCGAWNEELTAGGY
jgi:hypothetical protein